MIANSDEIGLELVSMGTKFFVYIHIQPGRFLSIDRHSIDSSGNNDASLPEPSSSMLPDNCQPGK